MEFGLVSNCWKLQLAAGEEPLDLVAEAVSRGFTIFEWRQTCLGRFEHGPDFMPDARQLAELPDRFPNARFSLAMALPFWSPDFEPDDRAFLAGASAAQAMAGRYSPRLRLVDLATPHDVFESQPIVDHARRLCSLAGFFRDSKGELSFENARESWGRARETLRQARDMLVERADSLLLCYDAVNLLMASDRPDPAAVVENLPANWLAMVHVKQRKKGQPLPFAAPGDIDWPKQLRTLEEQGYAGPILFEIEPSPEIRENLERSREFVQTCLTPRR